MKKDVPDRAGLPAEEALPRGTEGMLADMTFRAARGDYDPLAGREAELARTVEILCRRTKSNPLLLGDPGVGKTAIVEGLAVRIADGRVPEALKKSRLLALDLAAVISGTRYRGEFEERLRAVLAAVRESGRCILFIDEAHLLVGAGGAEGAIDAGNLLKPALARGEMQVIGATTFAEYRRRFEKDAALARRFRPVTVAEPGEERCVEMLRALCPGYERHHGVAFSEGALQAAARLSARYIHDRALPDKAVDLMDEAAARVRIRASAPRRGAGRPRVGPEDVAETVSAQTGIPLSDLSGNADLRSLEADLSREVVGQPRAVEAVCRAVLRGRSGLEDPGRPPASFLFYGPTGVGKTELARALGRRVYGPDGFLRLDMTEYADRSAVTRLIGAPPGYTGHEEGGQLTDWVRGRPYALVLFDEAEKADRAVCHLLLQILEEGCLTDGLGRRVSFAGVTVVLTANGGAAPPAGFGRRPAAEPALRAFPPELLGRIGERIPFSPLTREDLRRIGERMLGTLARRAEERGVRLVWEASLPDVLAERAEGLPGGARALRGLLQKTAADPLAAAMLSGELAPGARVRLGAEGLAEPRFA